jgi:aerobic-type carbon monoxide dehydrogenase small subunit (CoxS/CutS family)
MAFYHVSSAWIVPPLVSPIALLNPRIAHSPAATYPFLVRGTRMPSINLLINGQTFHLDAEPNATLLSVLREQLDLTGSKYGCGEGQCGACTVLIDGRAHRSCITPVWSVANKSVTTIEGLAHGQHLHPVQQAFLDEGAMQCAYCTSGMIMSAVSLLNNKRNPSDAEILEFMQGNICRCGTYPRIVAAIRKAATAMPEPRP